METKSNLALKSNYETRQNKPRITNCNDHETELFKKREM